MASGSALAPRPPDQRRTLLTGLAFLVLSLAATVVIVEINLHDITSSRDLRWVLLVCLALDYFALRFLRRAEKQGSGQIKNTARACGGVAVLLLLLHFANYVMEAASRSGWW